MPVPPDGKSKPMAVVARRDIWGDEVTAAASGDGGGGRSGDVLCELTPRERAFAMRQRSIECISAFLFPFQMASWNQTYLTLCGHDTGIMAVHYGKVAIGNNLGGMFLNPFFGGLSDRFGRKMFLTFGRLGWIVFWVCLGQPWMTLRSRLFLEWTCWGVLQAGSWTVFAASHSDVFGDTPNLSSRIKTADQVYANLFRFGGAVAGPLVMQRWGPQRVFYICCGLTTFAMGLLATCAETLQDHKMKPFSLSRSNPFANIHRLFVHGPGLRGLTASTALWFSCNALWSTQSAYRFGVLRWSPADDSRFTSCYNIAGLGSQKWVVVPFLRRVGNRKAFEIGALATAVGYLIQSQSSRWAGAGKLQMAIQYAVGMMILQAWPAAMPNSMRAMIVKQGMETSDAGKGELNAAYGGIGSIVGVFSPLMWGSLYKFFSGPKPASLKGPVGVLARALGPGGHMVIASKVILSWLVLRGVASDSLHLGDGDVGPARRKRQQDARN
jgi:hypothetical protein